MTDDLHREAFEEWATGKTWFMKTQGHFRRNCTDTHYNHFHVNDRWMAWQAAMRYRDELEKEMQE